VSDTGTNSRVAILMGSATDADKMARAGEFLTRFGIDHETHVMSAHRSPAEVAAFAEGARAAGLAAIICGAGLAAHLAGAVAAHTTIPVIGVPLSGGVGDGLDALLSTVQMPRGIPVATVGVDNSGNAALLAVSIISLGDPEVAEQLDRFRADGAR
jgi:5-(carboxyamino)imidazole ribonucleotide mutase